MLLMAFALASCGESNVNKADGSWQCDPQATVALLDDAAKKMAGMVSGLADGILQNVEFDLNARSKTVTAGMFGLHGSSKFTVVSDSGSSLVIKSGENTLHLDFRDKNTLDISGGPDAHKFVFKRVK
jgi:hypothetical protein